MNELQRLQGPIRIQLLVNYGTKLLHSQFRLLYKQATGNDWVDGPIDGQKFVESMGEKVYTSAKTLQKKLLRKGNVNSWDLSLLQPILTTTIKFDGSKKDLAANRQSIDSLVQVRNKFAHLGDELMTDEEFMKWWDQGKSAVLAFGGDLEIIDQYLTCSLSDDPFGPEAVYTIRENMVLSSTLRENGQLSWESGDIERGISIYSEALDLPGTSARERGQLFATRSYLYLDSIYEDEDNDHLENDESINEQLQLALEDANSAIKLLPTWRIGYYRAGRVYEYQKDYISAITAYNKALGLDPCQEDVRKLRDECRFEAQTSKTDLFPSVPTFLSHIPFKKKKFFERTKKFMESKDERTASRNIVRMAKLYFHGLVPAELPPPVTGTAVDDEDSQTEIDDYLKAAELFQKAGDMGNPDGYFCLGLLHLWGYGLDADLDKAAALFEKATELDSVKGAAVSKDDEEELIAIGDAQFTLAGCYAIGVGKPLDLNMAAQLYAKATNGGHSLAAYRLGFLFEGGFGVRKDWEEAVKCWKIAAEGGVTEAMEILANGYLEHGRIREAFEWLQNCVKSGLMTQPEMEDKVNAYIQNRSGGVAAFEHVLGLDRLSHHYSILDSIDLADRLSQATVGYIKNSHVDRVVKPFSCRDEIEVKAADGSKYAQSLRNAMTSWAQGNDLISEQNDPEAEQKEKILAHFADSYRIVHLAPDDRVKAKLTTMVSKAIQKTSQQHPSSDRWSQVDLNARICHLALRKGVGELFEILEFAKMSKLRHPQEEYFHDVHCTTLLQMGRRQECDEALTESIKIFPTSASLAFLALSSAAATLEVEARTGPQGCTAMVENAYQRFLELVDRDDYRVPDCHYMTAYFIGLNSLYTCMERDIEVAMKTNVPPSSSGGPKNLPPAALQMYEKGLEAENFLLPCFRPYFSPWKNWFDTWFSVFEEASKLVQSEDSLCSSSDTNFKMTWHRKFKSIVGDEKQEDSTSSAQSQPTQDKDGPTMPSPHELLTCSERVNVVTTHRRNLMKNTNDICINQQRTQLIPAIHRVQETRQSLAGSDGHLYHAFVVDLTVMEDSIFVQDNNTTTIHTVCRDSSGSFHNYIFTNFEPWDKFLAQQRRLFAFGSVLRVTGPTMLFTEGDKQCFNLVEHPKWVKFVVDDGEMGTRPKCRFCGRFDPPKKCSCCKIALYCDRECQVKDFELLKHKYVCKRPN